MKKYLILSLMFSVAFFSCRKERENEAIALRTWFRDHPDVAKQKPPMKFPVAIKYANENPR